MHNDKNPKFPAIYGFTYGPETRGLTVEKTPQFIRERAYQFFEMRGRQPGHELDDWLQAEREIKFRLRIS